MLASPPAIVCQGPPAAGESRDAIYARAVQERLGGKAAAAVGDLQTLLARNPDDADARLQLGFALRAEGRSAEAEAAFRAVLKVAPDYKDARVALAQVLLARGDAAGAKDALGDQLLSQPGDPETRSLVEKVTGTGASGPWRIDENVAYSQLTQGLPDWWENDLSISRKVDPNSAVTATVQTIRRFKIDETYVGGGYDRGWSLGEWSVDVGGSLDPTFRPKFSIGGAVDVAPAVDSPWRLAGAANFSSYVAGDVENVTLGADRLFLGDAAKLGLRFIGTHDESDHYLAGFSAAGSYRFNPRVDATASYTDAAETDTGRTVRVRAVAVGSDLTLTDQAILHATITSEAREHSYDRVEFALGATAKF